MTTLDSSTGPLVRQTASDGDPAGRVLLFPSTHQALAAEDALRRAHIVLKVIPVPPQYSAGCGLAIRVGEDDVRDACDVLERSTVRYTLPQTE